MKQIPLFGTGLYGKSAVVTDQRRVNVYYEIREDEDKAKIVIYGTPGTSYFSVVGGYPGRGIYPFGSYLYVVASYNLYKIDITGAYTMVGSLNTQAGNVSMSDNGTQLMIVDGVNGYIYNPGTATFAQITDPDFPNGATTVGFLDGFFIVEKPNTGEFWKSASYDGLTWAGTDFATAESNPDNLIAVDVDHGVAQLWGGVSIEFWQNGGVLGFPFVPFKSSTAQWGLAARWSRAKFMNSTAFLAQNLQGQVQVMMLNQFTPQRISNHDLETIINKFSVVADATAIAYMVNGHQFYQINFPTAMRSFLYDGTTNIWGEIQTGVGLTGRHIANFGTLFNGATYVTSYQDATILKIDDTVYTDNGTTIPRIIQTRHIIDQGNVIGIDELFLDMETGVGLQSGQGSDPQIVINVSKDGGRTFGNDRFCSFGAVGRYRRAIWRRFGSSRGFVFRFTMTDPVKFVVTYGAAVTRGMGK